MNLIWTVAGVTLIGTALIIFIKTLTGKKGATSVSSGDTKASESAWIAVAAVLIVLGAAVLFRQMVAVVGEGASASDPWAFNWLDGIMKQIATGGLPTFK